MKRGFTNQDKLDAVERLIEVMRWSRPRPETEQHDIRELLKAIARDLRANLGDAPLRTMVSLEYQIEAARRQKAQLGFVEIGTLQTIGNEVINKWAAIRGALEAMEGGR